MNHLFETLRGFGLPVGEYAVFGSGPLIVRGLIPLTNDLDIICRGSAWDLAKSLGRIDYLEEYDMEVVATSDGQITLGKRWGIGDPNVDALIDEAEMIDGLPFVAVKHVVEYKLIRGSPKDQEHIRVIKENGLA